MRDHVRFQSIAFAPTRPEASETNPGRYGFELSTWLGAQLRSSGITASDPIAEDWGWLLQTVYRGETLSIGCGNVDGTRDEWLVWIEAERPTFVRRLFGGRGATPDTAVRDSVAMAIDRLLRDNASVSAIEWFRTRSDLSEIDHAAHP